MRALYRVIYFLFRHGVLNLFLEIRNRKLFDEQESKDFNFNQTSLTDSHSLSAYADFCELASENDKVFDQFRRAKIIHTVYDHVTIDFGKSYIHEISKHGPLQMEYQSVMRLVDSFGNPRKYHFPFFGQVSPTTLRYLKVYLDLKHFFGSFKNFKITEIGIGFGGQASLIGMMDPPEMYRCFDIPPVLKLTNKFISKLELVNSYEYCNGRIPLESSSDLVISNYAFSELSRSTQESYLDNVILKSPRGYITWNTLGEEILSAYSLADLIRKIPGSQIIPELPYTRTGNVILIWGHDPQ